jgi:addiction module HigA family antidote
MSNHSHPGEMLRSQMGDQITVTALAEHLGVTRAHLSSILNGHSGISPTMSLKLDEAFKKPDGFFSSAQYRYDLATAQKQRTKLKAISELKIGKRSHPDFMKVTAYLRKQTHKSAQRKWEDSSNGDFSDLVQDLLERYLEN